MRAYHATYGLDVVVTRGSNTYGPFHHPEKLIPLFVTNALDDAPLPLYGDGLQRRDWLHVADHAGAIAHVLAHGAAGEVYNVPGSVELTNREVVGRLLALLEQALVAGPLRRRPARPRPALRDGRAPPRRARLGEPVGFDEGLAQTVALVPRPRVVVARGARWRLGRLLRPPVRRAARHVGRGGAGSMSGGAGPTRDRAG